MVTEFKVGDQIEYNGYFRELGTNGEIFIVEEVNEETGWIWSSQFPMPYMDDYFISNKKNFYNPLGFRISKAQLREDKLKDIGIY
jgi:hypothetical protein